ncbi:MAG: SURF1 family cytochrome oxidase biogenesis protein [Rhizomicrobium sp.]
MGRSRRRGDRSQASRTRCHVHRAAAPHRRRLAFRREARRLTPPPDRARRIWYVRDVAGIARADGFAVSAPALIEADAAPNPGGWPKGGQTVVTFRNEHLQYAITWYLMAAALLGVYLAYHVSQGRLGLTRKD